MNYTEFYNYARGHHGSIYTARKGSVMVFCLDDGHEYMLSTTAANGKVVVDAVKDYWCHSIDFAGNFGDYFTFGIVPWADADMPYKASPIVEMTSAQIAKLQRSTSGAI